MKKVFSILLSTVLLCASMSLISCQKDDGGKTPGGDSGSGGSGGNGLAGTSWVGNVNYSFKSSGSGASGGGVSGTLTITFESGSKCYNGFWEESVPYTQSGNTIEMKWSKENGVMKLVKNGNSMTVSGSDDKYTYSGSISKK